MTFTQWLTWGCWMFTWYISFGCYLAVAVVCSYMFMIKNMRSTCPSKQETPTEMSNHIPILSSSWFYCVSVVWKSVVAVDLQVHHIPFLIRYWENLQDGYWPLSIKIGRGRWKRRKICDCKPSSDFFFVHVFYSYCAFSCTR